MKHLIIVLTILLFNSCNLDNQPGKKKDLTNSAIQKPNSLIGEWIVNVTISENVSEMCNDCPKISFLNDQTATVIFPSGDRQNLKWKANGNKLILTTINNRNMTEIFPDSLYEMTFTQEKNCIELELKQTEKKYSEILRR